MVNVSQLKKGDILSETQYYTVDGVDANGIVKVTNNRNFSFGISKPIVEEGLVSSSQYTEEKKVSKTELALFALDMGDSVFEVSFQKQDNTERILRGYKIGNEAHFGRIKVVDLEADKSKGSNIRLVDLRELNYLVYRGVKYISKH